MKKNFFTFVVLLGIAVFSGFKARSVVFASTEVSSTQTPGNYLLVGFDSNDTSNTLYTKYFSGLTKNDFNNTNSIVCKMDTSIANGGIGYAKLYYTTLSSVNYYPNMTTDTAYPYYYGGLYNLNNLKMAVGYYDKQPTPQWQTITANVATLNDIKDLLNLTGVSLGFISKENTGSKNMGFNWLGKSGTTSFNVNLTMIRGYFMISEYTTDLQIYNRGYNQGAADIESDIENHPHNYGLYNQQDIVDTKDYWKDYGYREGQNASINVSWIQALLTTATNFFNIELLPGVRIIYLIGAIVIIKFVMFIIGIIK